MAESEGQNSESGTVLEKYVELRERVEEEFPGIVETVSIERNPGDYPRNLRIFSSEGFVDVFVFNNIYSFH